MEGENKFNIPSSVKPLIAGLASGATSLLLLYPLDLVKVRLQVTESGRKRGITQTLRSIVHHEGIAGLYQGLTPALFGSAVSWGGYFFFYEEIKKKMTRHKLLDGTKKNADLGSMENFTAACISGAIMVGFTNPIWLIKTRMQLQMKKFQEHQIKSRSVSSSHIKPPYKNMIDAASTIVREEGLLALYKGALPALLLVSHGGVQFVVYENLKIHFGEYKKESNKSNCNPDEKSHGVFERLRDSIGYLTMGAGSKIIASTVTYPIQVIKSRIQQRSQTAELNAKGDVEIVERHYRGVVSAFTKIYQNEGILGFFKGSIANALRVAPSSAITFVVYETIMETIS